ncbi:MAG: homoserine O-succinyltransferase, partial [Pseudoxanthomonas sp.]
MSFVNNALHAVPSVAPATAYEPLPEATHASRGEISIRLELRHAGVRQVTLRYELLGEAGLPVVFVAGGISAHRHVVASDIFPENGWANALAQA